MRTKTKKLLAISLLLAIGITLVFIPWGCMPCPFCELYRLEIFIWAPQPLEDLTQHYNVTRLTTSPADDRNPVWSPDGSKIFFKSDNWICVCNPDGTHRENLTRIKEPFVFSPDMKRIFYVKVPVDEEKMIYQAYVMAIDGKNREKIAELAFEQKYVDGYVEGDWGYIGSTNIGSNRREQYEMCSWGPDRTKIFFTKLEETGYNWVWNEEERKWAR